MKALFFKLPWQYKIIVTAGSLFILMTIIHISTLLLKSEPPPMPTPISIAAETDATSIFDPSIAFNADGSQGFLVYTALEKIFTPGTPPVVQTHIAYTASGCKNFTYSGIAFDGRSDDLLSPDGYTPMASGNWRVETPSIIYDPEDVGREWKAYAYKYFWPNDNVKGMSYAARYGVITYKYSSEPIKGWSTEEWLMGAAPEFPPNPYQQIVQMHINTLDESLAGYTHYARPSVLYRQRVLLMTLSAFKGVEQFPDRVILLASLDHGRKWIYSGALLTKDDAAKMGDYTRISGATLLEQDNAVYLAATLGDDKTAGLGTFILGFESLPQGKLLRDASTGAPQILRHIGLNSKTPSPLGGGFSAYHDKCTTGLLMSEQSAGQVFQIIRTHQKPVAYKD